MIAQVKTYVNDDTFTAECVKTYAMKFKANEFGVLEEIDAALNFDKTIDDELSNAGAGGGVETSPSEQLDRLAKKFIDDHPSYNYVNAVKRVLNDNPELKFYYAAEEGGRVRVHAEKGGGGDPAEEVHEKATALVERGTCDNYSEAVTRTLKSDPKLQQKWANFSSFGG